MDIKSQNYNNISFAGITKYPLIPFAELQALLSKGYSYERIGRMYGMPMHAVARSAHTHNLKPNTSLKREQNKISIIQMRRSGYTDAQISKSLKVLPGTVRKVIKEFSAQQYSEPDILSQIITRLHLSKDDISRFLK